MKIYFILLGAVLLILPSMAMAIPEIARNGHFTCTSCHVSPGGGGLLTSYGRDFGAEKLSTWHMDGEEKTLEGLIPTSDTFLVGGDARWIWYSRKSEGATFEKFWRMQTDLEAGVHAGPVYLTAMWGTKPAGPMDDAKDYSTLIHRGYMARLDLLDEHVVVRAGLFMPKYGLMLADHTAYVRSANGLSPDGAQTQAEVLYQSDLFEFSVATLFENDLYDRKGKSRSGFSLGASTFIAEKDRVTVNVMSTKLVSGTTESQRVSMGVSAVVTMTNSLYSMLEIDRVHNSTKSDTLESYSEALVNYFSVNYEAYTGLVPYVRYEYLDTDMNKPDTSTTRMGAGVNWYPRPHMQFEFRSLRATAGSRTTDEMEGLLHYYF
jgi:hypothetical protein